MSERYQGNMAAWIAAGPYAKEPPQPMLRRTMGDINGERNSGKLTASEMLKECLPELLERAFDRAERLFPRERRVSYLVWYTIGKNVG